MLTEIEDLWREIVWWTAEMMTDQLKELTAGKIIHIAHKRGWTIERATQYINQHLVEAREEYRAIGAPYGDDDQSFYLWLTRRPTTPAA